MSIKKIIPKTKIKKQVRQMSKLAHRYTEKIFPSLLVVIAVCSLAGVLYSATPNPGHPWTQVGDGFWAATGTTAYRTFTFPDATATVLTSFTPVTVAQGGTGTTSTSTALNVLTGLSVKGDVLVHTGSIHARLPVGQNNYVLTADSATTTGVKWAVATSVPAGSDGQVQFNDAGVMGANSSFRYDKTNQTLGLNGELDILTQTDPATPAADTLRVYAKKISGRSMLKAKSPYGIDYPYQPGFFQNAIFLLMTGSGTFGLDGMKRRAAKIGGSLTLESTADGTTISLTVPLP